MKSIVVQKLGGPEVLQLAELPKPAPKAGEVLVRVRAIGLNFADILAVRGEYLTRTRLPYVPGMEFSGTIEELGEGVEGLQPGQLVAALGSGAFAEYATVPAQAVLPVPPNLSPHQAAALPVSFYTAFFALHSLGQAKVGESVLIQAAGGALGTASVQVAKAMGLQVIATASREEKLELARSLGADHAFLSTDPELEAKVREASGKGVDVLMELVGGEGFAQSLRMLAPRGRLLVIGSASQQQATLRPVELMKKNLSVIGVWLVPFLADREAMLEATQFLTPLLAAGHVRPVVGRVFRLEEAAQAFQYVLQRASTGKVVLEP
ncbi:MULTISPECIES: NADPH:quinone oxidoreductase family protein [unclassified Meiothermus]|uniref:quinone oxidoreductase family protein n=1 Tax=unclassified Meiothermus TaxID=370471 RepID=UPI000D7C5D59|nr:MULTISPECIES: NADPH:quinone oxidoreductase family protein [unclassified Meiothermus]PZA06612.1 NADPH:quinone oxidoreductase family protein [Meiothermus sp. Pnk-1]RYM37716.1 NADPH:quinone oxidoreductase family protein [Meiothermus sp. PNK-Is4]